MRFKLRHILIGMALLAVPLCLLSLSLNPRWGRLYNSVRSVAFSPDGKKLAVIHYRAYDANVPGKMYKANVADTVALFDAQDLSTATIVDHSFRKGNQGPSGNHAIFHSASFSANGDSLFIFAGPWFEPKWRAWNIAAGNFEPGGDSSARERFHRTSPDGSLIAISRKEGIEVSNASTRQVLLSLPGGLSTFSFDSKNFAIATEKGVQVWDIGAKKIIRTFHENRDVLNNVTCLAFSPDGAAVAVRCQEGLRLYSLRSGAENMILPEHFEVTRTSTGYGTRSSGEHTIGIAYSPDGKLLASWGTYGLKFFDVTQDYNLKRSIAERLTLCLAFAPDSKTYATGDNAGKLTIWDTATGKEIRSTNFR